MAGRKKAVNAEEVYIVKEPFRDVNNFALEYEIGTDVSHFDKKRLEKLVIAGVVTASSSVVKPADSDDEDSEESSKAEDQSGTQQ